VGGEAPERLVTTIGAGELAAGELAEVYHMRWGVETCFEFMKDRLQMENFTGTSPRLIEQDVYVYSVV
jgi:IS4 transposase